MPFQIANVVGFVFFALWFLIAVANLVNPHYVWKITQSWKAKVEPPQAYFVYRRVGAGVMLVLGIAFLVFVQTRT